MTILRHVPLAEVRDSKQSKGPFGGIEDLTAASFVHGGGALTQPEFPPPWSSGRMRTLLTL